MAYSRVMRSRVGVAPASLPRHGRKDRTVPPAVPYISCREHPQRDILWIRYRNGNDLRWLALTKEQGSGEPSDRTVFKFVPGDSVGGRRHPLRNQDAAVRQVLGPLESGPDRAIGCRIGCQDRRLRKKRMTDPPTAKSALDQFMRGAIGHSSTTHDSVGNATMPEHGIVA